MPDNDAGLRRSPRDREVSSVRRAGGGQEGSSMRRAGGGQDTSVRRAGGGQDTSVRRAGGGQETSMRRAGGGPDHSSVRRAGGGNALTKEPPSIRRATAAETPAAGEQSHLQVPLLLFFYFLFLVFSRSSFCSSRPSLCFPLTMVTVFLARARCSNAGCPAA